MFHFLRKTTFSKGGIRTQWQGSVNRDPDLAVGPKLRSADGRGFSNRPDTTSIHSPSSTCQGAVGDQHSDAIPRSLRATTKPCSLARRHDPLLPREGDDDAFIQSTALDCISGPGDHRVTARRSSDRSWSPLWYSNIRIAAMEFCPIQTTLSSTAICLFPTD